MKTDYSRLEPAGYTIKKAESHHIPLLNDIELAAAALFPENSLPEHILSEKLPTDILQSAKDGGMLWVAVDEKDFPVGYILLQIIDGIALLAQVDVHPDHGRQGLGTALVMHGIEKIHKYGYAELYLTTFSDIKWNAPFYKKLGFSILKNDELPNAIVNILHEEHERGLNNRVAMRIKIGKDE